MPTTLEFLRAILPDQGKYCAVVIDPSDKAYRRQYFYDTVEAFAASLLQLDAASQGTKRAVYHGCASYTGRSRRASDTVALRSLYCEFDCGDSDDFYRTTDDALVALAGFCRTLSLPIPLVVWSGGGLHCYWPLRSALSRAQWQPLAAALKAALLAHGVHADPHRTADCASILRPPGTTHRKGTPTPVRCGPIMGPYDLEQFNELQRLAVAGPVHLVGGQHGHHPVVQGRVKQGLRQLLEVRHAPEPIDFGCLLTGCAQLRDFQETHGNLPEPLWYAGLGVLGFCANGDAVGHDWSSGHPNYSPGETQARLDRARQLSGPTTCARFRDLNPAGCNGCAFGASTPLEAARELRPQTASAAPAPVAALEDNRAPPDGTVLVEGKGEYQILNGGVHFVSADEAGKTQSVMITAFPVVFKSVHVGEIKRDQSYYLMSHWKPHEGWRDVELKASQLYGQAMVPTMADLGVQVHNPARFTAYARDAVDALQRKEKSRMQYEQFGWKAGNTAFLYGDALYTAEGATATAVSNDLRHRSQWLRPAPGGSVDGWKRAVDNLMGQGSEGMSFTILASFAAPLMRLLEPNEGGAVVNLMTRQSGAGKSTSLSGAYTVWSSSEHGLGLTQIDTKVSKAIALGMLSNLPVVYDEFTNKDPAVVREFMIMFTSGRDKMRADSAGNLINKAASWQTLLITASNQSLRDTVMSTGESDAPAMRILEMPVESSGSLKPSELIKLKAQMEGNAGHAGAAFLTYLLQPDVLAWTQKKLLELMDETMLVGNFRKEHRFWVRTLAATATAALLVEKLGLISFSPQRIMTWAMRHFGQRVAPAADARPSMLPALSQFMNAHLEETLTMPGPAEGRRAFQPIGEKPRRRISARVELRGETTWVVERTLREWMERHTGGGYSELVAELAREGMLRQERRALTLTAGTDIEGGQVWCLGFDNGHPLFTGFVREMREVKRHDGVVAKLKMVK